MSFRDTAKCWRNICQCSTLQSISANPIFFFTLSACAHHMHWCLSSVFLDLLDSAKDALSVEVHRHLHSFFQTRINWYFERTQVQPFVVFYLNGCISPLQDLNVSPRLQSLLQSTCSMKLLPAPAYPFCHSHSGFIMSVVASMPKTTLHTRNIFVQVENACLTNESAFSSTYFVATYSKLQF